MKTLCGIDCKEVCSMYKNGCPGCRETDGKPFGGACVAAECVRTGGEEGLRSFKQKVVDEINALGIPELTVKELYYLSGAYVNLAYPMDDGSRVKFLDDKKVYLGCQIERKGNDRCYGVVASESFILVCEYGCEGKDPALVAYRKR